MHITVAAATYNEIGITAEWLKTQGTSVEVLITGIGAAITAHSLSRHIYAQRPALVIQAGVAGSFVEALPPETVAFVNEEVFADLGAIDLEGPVDIFDLGLAAVNDHPFKNKMLVNPDTRRWQKYQLPFVKGATINCVSSTTAQVQRIKAKYDPAVESMEGAALHYVCLMENIPFIQLRSISNYVGERDKKNWKLKEAITILNHHLKKIIAEI